MSIFIKGSEQNDGYPPHEKANKGEEACFLCGGMIGKTAIHWMGSDSDIYFHPECAISFCRRIMQDCERYYDPKGPLHNEPKQKTA